MYLLREFPSPADFDGRPLVFTTIVDEDANTTRSVYGYTNEPTPSDALVRCAHDELFVEANGITSDASSYVLVQRQHRDTIVGAYVGSYVLDSNS